VDERSSDEVRQPRSEPEILPPGPPRRRGAGDPGPRTAYDRRGFERVYVFRPRPLTALLAVLAVGGVALALVVILLGAVLVALPVVGAIVAIGLLTALLRGARRQFP
jgi:Flp pilus assembly protein TadB